MAVETIPPPADAKTALELYKSSRSVDASRLEGIELLQFCQALRDKSTADRIGDTLFQIRKLPQVARKLSFNSVLESLKPPKIGHLVAGIALISGGIVFYRAIKRFQKNHK